jgi:hypothetical protein
MIRQAHTYLAGAVSGTALIAVAVVGFVMLVSLQALRDWPLASIGGGGNSVAVSSGQPVAGTKGPLSLNAASAGVLRRSGTGANVTGRQNGGGGSLGGRQGGNAGGETSPVPSGADAPSSSPAGDAGSTSPSASGGSTGAGSGRSTSGAVTGTVNKTVSGVDQTTGGTLGSTGVTEVTEETVNDVAGPESLVGKTVDETVKTVGGLLGGGK